MATDSTQRGGLPFRAARAYVAAGLSVMPIMTDGTKRPLSQKLPRIPNENGDGYKPSWLPFTERLPTDEELARMFGGPEPVAVAAICGAVSGGMEVLDLDEVSLIDQFMAEVREGWPGLWDKLSQNQTPSGGLHLAYRCAEIQGNQPLARRPPNAEERKRNPKRKWVVMFETRGEGGYIVAPGSPKETHEANRLYKHVGGPKLTELVTITEEERGFLIRTARSFDQVHEDGRVANPAAGNLSPGELTPADDFDRRGPSFEDLLSETGAVFKTGGGDFGKVARPGKEKGWSATVGYCKGASGEPLLYVFSTNFSPFEALKTYGKYHVYRLLKHGGNGSDAMRALRKEGYGADRPRPGKPADGNRRDEPADMTPEAWTDPVELEDGASQVEPFPMDVYPKRVAEYFQDVAGSIGCPVDYPAVFGLGVAAGVTGALYKLKIKESHLQTTNLYLCVIAPPGSKKTPALNAVATPVYDEHQRREREQSERGPAFLSDVTAERVAELLQNHPRGFPIIRDELRAWVSSMDQYKSGKSGSDRQFWMEAHSGLPTNVQRKDPNRPKVSVRHPAISVVGGTQPSVIAKMKGDDDGFFDRLQFSWADPGRFVGETWKTPHQDLLKHWTGVMENLFTATMPEGAHGPHPNFLELDRDARDEWEAWSNDVARKLNDPEYPEHLRNPTVKLEGMAGRMALVLHALWTASTGSMWSRLIGREMASGVALAKYFLSHARKVHGLMGRDPRVAQAKKVLDWLRRWQHPTFTRRDIYRGLRHSFQTPEEIEGPLKLLKSCGWVRWAGDGENVPRGSYEVHPKLSQS